jgi:hypothetical protein
VAASRLQPRKGERERERRETDRGHANAAAFVTTESQKLSRNGGFGWWLAEDRGEEIFQAGKVAEASPAGSIGRIRRALNWAARIDGALCDTFTRKPRGRWMTRRRNLSPKKELRQPAMFSCTGLAPNPPRFISSRALSICPPLPHRTSRTSRASPLAPEAAAPVCKGARRPKRPRPRTETRSAQLLPADPRNRKLSAILFVQLPWLPRQILSGSYMRSRSGRPG